MQSRNLFRAWLAVSCASLLAACGSENPYARFKDPPLVNGELHTVTLVSDSQVVVESVTGAGWKATTLPPNYPQADAVQAVIWGVPAPVAASALQFLAGQSGQPDLRVLVMPLAAKGHAADEGINEAFFRNVLGSPVPGWPLPGAQPANVRVQVWTYRVPDIVAASKKLRANGIPVIYDPVGITTAYQGDHRTLAIRAPDGTVVQLVQSAAQ